MLRYAREAVSLAQYRTRSDLDTDRVLGLALVRLIEIVGEAASRVSAPTRERHPQIPWSEITNMRNRLIHGYDAVDMDILWQTLQQDLPQLIAALEQIIGPEQQ
ncbi:MAG: DUF86 domain-containing protein [Chloroflexi bacterium]|nr:DUF86 domain-containing protein [Chloroflexota bacterium]